MKQIINITAHRLDFWNPDGSTFVIPPSVFIFNAGFRETSVYRNSVEHVTSTPIPTEEGLAMLYDLEKRFPGAVIVGSEISAQAYPERVVSTIPAPGTSKASMRRLARCDKFRIFPAI